MTETIEIKLGESGLREEFPGRIRWFDGKLQQEFTGTERITDFNGVVVGGRFIQEWRDVPEEKP